MTQLNNIIQKELDSFLKGKGLQKGCRGYRIEGQEMTSDMPVMKMYRLLRNVAGDEEVSFFFIELQLKIMKRVKI